LSDLRQLSTSILSLLGDETAAHTLAL